MRVLITGANGYVGARLHQDLGKSFEVYGTYHNAPSSGLQKLDITDRREIKSLVDKIKPDMIVHAAAIVGKELCEKDPSLAHRVNVEGTENIALVAADNQINVVHISTGAVLIPGTDNTYIKTKSEAEKALVGACDRYVILRLGSVMGQSPRSRDDSYQNLLINNIVNKTPQVYDDVDRFQFTWLGHVSEVITKVGEKDISKEIIPVIAKDTKTRFEVARDILKNFGVDAIPKREKNSIERKFATTDKLQELEMPVYSYQQIIDKTVQEIRDWLEHGKQS